MSRHSVLYSLPNNRDIAVECQNSTPSFVTFVIRARKAKKKQFIPPIGNWTHNWRIYRLTLSRCITTTLNHNIKNVLQHRNCRIYLTTLDTIGYYILIINQGIEARQWTLKQQIINKARCHFSQFTYSQQSRVISLQLPTNYY